MGSPEEAVYVKNFLVFFSIPVLKLSKRAIFSIFEYFPYGLFYFIQMLPVLPLIEIRC